MLLWCYLPKTRRLSSPAYKNAPSRLNASERCDIAGAPPAEKGLPARRPRPKPQPCRKIRDRNIVLDAGIADDEDQSRPG
jgi:hypothetical protein